MACTKAVWIRLNSTPRPAARAAPQPEEHTAALGLKVLRLLAESLIALLPVQAAQSNNDP